MAPQEARKRKSEVVQDTVATPPTEGPSIKRLKITQAQKQALIDNLQLEITERARGLRAHYALQASDLRSRVERRINRIPISLRKANMGDLLAKHAEKPVVKVNPAAAPARRVLTSEAEQQASTTSKQLSPSRAISKHHARSSPELAIHSDKENCPSPRPVGLNNPKNPKRTGGGLGTKRAVSRAKNSGTVLSPKSHNSRTLPRSPIKDTHSSDTENQIPNHPAGPPTPSPIRISKLSTYRPTSPLKPPTSPMKLKSAASAAASSISASLSHLADTAKRSATATASGSLRRTASKDKLGKPGLKAPGNGRMGPPPRPNTATANERPASQVSNHSSVSSGTTVVTKTKITTSAAAAGSVRGKTGLKVVGKASALKTTTVGSVRVGTGQSAVGKRVVLAEPAAGRRVLRTRG